jgi:hypothetical protein
MGRSSDISALFLLHLWESDSNKQEFHHIFVAEGKHKDAA